MHLFRSCLLCSFAVLFLTVLSHCQIRSQSSNNKVIPKTLPAQKAVKPIVADQPLSKEFMILGRKAFAAVDRMNEHFLDTKEARLHNNIMEVSDEKESWVLSVATAEKASDDLQSLTETDGEKLIAQTVRDAGTSIRNAHNMIDADTEIAVRGWNLSVQLQTNEGVSTVGLVPSGFPAASLEAINLAKMLSEQISISPCFLAAKQAVITGVLKQCQSQASSMDNPVPQLTPEQKYINQLKIPHGTARVEDHILIYSLEVSPTSSADHLAAAFQAGVNSGKQHFLRSFGFERIRLEAGGRVFEWPIK